jgi:hypothetical protein
VEGATITSNREGTHWVRIEQDKNDKIIFKQVSPIFHICLTAGGICKLFRTVTNKIGIVRRAGAISSGTADMQLVPKYLLQPSLYFVGS